MNVNKFCPGNEFLEETLWGGSISSVDTVPEDHLISSGSSLEDSDDVFSMEAINYTWEKEDNTEILSLADCVLSQYTPLVLDKEGEDLNRLFEEARVLIVSTKDQEMVDFVMSQLTDFETWLAKEILN